MMSQNAIHNDDTLLRRMTATRHRSERRSRRKRLTFTVFTLTLVAAGLAAYQFLPRWRAGQEMDVLATQIVAALRSNDPSSALAQCVEADTVWPQIEADNLRVYREGSAPAPLSADALGAQQETQRGLLEKLLAQATESGFNWGAATLAGYGSVVATVRDADTMRRSLQVATGEFYVSDGTATCVVDFTARRCDGRYYLTEAWLVAPEDFAGQDIAARAASQYEHFLNECAIDGKGSIRKAVPVIRAK